MTTRRTSYQNPFVRRLDQQAGKPKPAKKLSITDHRQQKQLDAASDYIAKARGTLQELFDELYERRSKMEEHFSGTERYSRFEEACQAVEEAIEALDGIEIDIKLP